MVCIAVFYTIKLPFVLLTEFRPKSSIFLNYRRDDFIGLGKVVVKVDVFKALRNPSPPIDFLFRQSINVISNFFVRNQHQMNLIFATAIALFSKILQHLCIADRCLGDICLQELAEFVINDINACISF